MTVDPTMIPGLLLLAAEFIALAAVGYVVARVALRQTDERMALAQGLVAGPALWGLIANLVMYAVPGLAGATVGWGVVLVLGIVLARRAPDPIRPRLRVVAGFAVAFLALSWVALASRQLLSVSDPQIQLGQAAAIRAGAFPPELPWSPGLSAPYHYGASLLAGLLAPPTGPDLAFTWELLGVYAWTSFVLLFVTLLLQRSSGFAVAVTAPLLLSTGAWTFPWFGDGLLAAPIPAGLPAAGLRASLADVYWPAATHAVAPDMRYAALPDIWKPAFPLAYALVVLVLERATHPEGRSRLAAVTLGALVGFTGLLALTLGPVLLVLWAGLEAASLLQRQRAGSSVRRAALQSAAGLSLATLLLVVGSVEVVVGLLDNSKPSSLSLTWNPDSGRFPPLDSLAVLPGGVGLLKAGPVVAAGVAILLAWRNRLVLALAVGVGVLVLAWLVLDYSPAPYDLNRLAGHARNLALVALLLALTPRLAALRPRWRYAAAVLLLGLVVWPTVVRPVRYLGLAIGQGTEIANARPPQGPYPVYGGRLSLDARPSDRVAAYVRDHTANDARVFSPNPNQMTYATGRPNAAGFVGLLHYISFHGPEYLDVLHYLEPAAIRRLGIGYVHAPDAWVRDLPDQAVQRLRNPRLFELLVRDDAEALYRVRPDFQQLDTAPPPQSFEALRQAVPASATVYAPLRLQHLGAVRTARTLSHARLLGDISPATLWLTSPWPSEPLGGEMPDLVILPLAVKPWMFPPAARRPIWWSASQGIAVYAPNGIVAPIMPPPDSGSPLGSSPPSIRVSDLRATDGRLGFTLTIDDQAPDRWTGQDWQLIAGEASRWAIPTQLAPDWRTPAVAQWFAGQMSPGRGTTTYDYTFDARTSRLAVRGASGQASVVATSGDGIGEGIWMLRLRVLRAVDRGTYLAQEDVAVIPVLQIEVSEAGDLAAFAYDNALGAEVQSSAESSGGA